MSTDADDYEQSKTDDVSSCHMVNAGGDLYRRVAMTALKSPAGSCAPAVSLGLTVSMAVA